MKLLSFAALASVLCGCACPCTRPARPRPRRRRVGEFQKRAAQFHAVVRVPAFETSSNEIQATFTKTLAAGNAALDRIGKVSPAKATSRTPSALWTTWIFSSPSWPTGSR